MKNITIERNNGTLEDATRSLIKMDVHTLKDVAIIYNEEKTQGAKSYSVCCSTYRARCTHIRNLGELNSERFTSRKWDAIIVADNIANFVDQDYLIKYIDGEFNPAAIFYTK